LESFRGSLAGLGPLHLAIVKHFYLLNYRLPEGADITV